MSRSVLRRAAWACCVAASASVADAQVIAVRTSRIAQGDLDGFLPSSMGGMGKLLAIPDTLAGLFDNPAAGARVRGTHVIVAPSLYDITRNAGGGSTVPVTYVRQVGPSFGTLALALQQLNPPRNELTANSPATVQILPADASSGGSSGGFASQVARNRYAFAMLGHRANVASLAASLKWSGQDAVDGGEFLYPGASGVRRLGNAFDLRLGAVRERPAATIEAVLLYSRSGATHDVTTSDRVFDPATRSFSQRVWIDRDRDRLDRFGAHVTLTRPIDSLWRVGAVLTGNRVVHAIVPTLGAMSIGRDPARAAAINAGIGFARVSGRTRLGFDAVYEPIRARGSINGVVNDDRYRFRNSILRGGVSHDFEPVPGSTIRLEFGAQVHRIRFDVERPGTTFSSSRVWNEWTHTWGVRVFDDEPFSVHVRGRIRSGVLRRGRPPDNGVFEGFAPADAGIVEGGFWTPPTPQLMGVRVATTQVSISVPVR